MNAVLVRKSTWMQLKSAVGKLSSERTFLSDLQVDKKLIRQNEGVPFLHWCRDGGTSIELLKKANAYPAPGERIPFLFGTKNREGLVAVPMDVAEYYRQYESREQVDVTAHYFDGRHLRQIDTRKALDIARDYRRRIESEWRSR